MFSLILLCSHMHFKDNKCIIFLTQILSTRALKATLYCNDTIYESSLKEYDYY